jgi:hypothetical protein
MKKMISVMICFAALSLLAACTPAPALETSAPSSTPPEASVQTSAPASASPSASKAQAEGTAAKETAGLYSSYAHMVSFDPQSGLADFDYFDMLRGPDAVNWLVEQEGYSLRDAEEVVGNYSVSEFIEKNTDPGLRTIDLNGVELTLMYKPDGTMAEGSPASVAAGIEDLKALYALDPDLALRSYFYYVTVQDGKAVSVDQVYWP